MKNRHDYGEFQFDEKFYAKHKDLTVYPLYKGVTLLYQRYR